MKKIIFVLILLISTFLFGCSSKKIIDEQLPEHIEFSLERCDRLNLQDERLSHLDKEQCYIDIIHDLNYVPEAISKNQAFIICDKVISPDLKEICYGYLAEAKKDSSVCDKIVSQKNKNYCWGIVAKAKKDSSICAKFNNQKDKDLCFGGVASAKKDSKICEEIIDQRIKDLCYINAVIIRKDNASAIIEEINIKRG